MKLTSDNNAPIRVGMFLPRRCPLFLAMALALVFAAPAHAQAAPGPDGRVTMPDTIQPISTDRRDLDAARAGSPRPAFSRALDAAETAVPMKIEFVLKTRHYHELQERVAAGETIGAAEMAARYLPQQSDYDAVSQWLRAQGFAVRTTGAARAMVIASGSPAQWEQALGAKFARVIARGGEYTAAVSPPSLPAELAAVVSNIHGLQPFLHPHKSAATPQDVGSENPPYLVSQLLGAYNASATSLTGAGQQIGIVIDTVPRDSDLTTFWNDNGVAQSLSNIITVNVEDETLPAPSGEETLDVSWSSGIAPGAQVVIYACGNLNNVNDSYSQILDDLQSGARPNLHQVSMSYAGGEVTDETSSDMDSTTQMFTSMTAYGVTLFASSGDNGAYGDNGKTIQVDYPASSPSVVGVGGTSLTLSIGGEEASETTWMSSGQGGGSSGGGISSFFARPKWQKGSTVPAGTMRLVPDVALDADPSTGGFLILNGREVEYGGTSWSSPTWAGFCALLNQGRAQAGLAPLGLANTTWYPLLGTAAFRDITSGGNGVYNAGVGYDLVTGLGVPDFDALLSAVPAPVLTQPEITSPGTAKGDVGRPFTYVITASGSPTSFDATGLPVGLSVSNAGVISGTPTISGKFATVLSASNSVGTASEVLHLTFVAVPPTITSPTAIIGQLDNPVTYQITATASPTAFAALDLPPGLTLNTATGVISGKPLKMGTSTATLEATNQMGTGDGSLKFTILARPVVTITADVPSVVAASGQSGQFAVKRTSADTTQSLTVSYTVQGSAEPGVDFVRLKGSKEIPAGRTTAYINVVPLAAANLAGSAAATVMVTLEPPADDAYRVGAEDTAKVKIVAKK